jgi:hypothetical protein
MDQMEKIINDYKLAFPELYSKTFNMTGGPDKSKIGLLAELVGFDISQFFISHANASIRSQSDIARAAMMGIIIGATWKSENSYTELDMNYAYTKSAESILRSEPVKYEDWMASYEKQPPTDDLLTVKPNPINGADFALWLRTVGVSYFAVKQLDPDLTEGWQIKGSKEEYSDEELYDLYLKSKENA